MEIIIRFQQLKLADLLSIKNAGKGLGGHIFKNVLINLINVKETVGFRFITIDAYASAFGFYVYKHDFKYLKHEEKNVKKIKEIIKKNPEKRFSLYTELEKKKN